MHIWFTHGFSSQGEIAALIKQASPGTRVSLTHKEERREILRHSEFSYPMEPQSDNPNEYFDYVKSVIAQAEAAGAPIDAILSMRQRGILIDWAGELERLGVRLLAGANTKTWLESCEDKWTFTQRMKAAGIIVPRTILVNQVDELLAAYKSFRDTGHMACIKPSVGVYGAGFWVLDDSQDDFAMLQDREVLRIKYQTYEGAFRRREEPQPHIMMEYLPGLETSLDAVVDNGKIVAHACRTKLAAGVQSISTGGADYEAAVKIAEVCGLNGLVNIQFKRCVAGIPNLLEVNTRPSGGIGYSAAAGINLPMALIQMIEGKNIRQVDLPHAVTVRLINSYVAVD